MKKNQAQKFIVLFLFFLFAYSWRVEAQTSKEKQLTMEFKKEWLPLKEFFFRNIFFYSDLYLFACFLFNN